MLLNMARAKEFMQKYDIDAIVATSPPNVSYVTDLDCYWYRTFRGYMLTPGGSNSLAQAYAILPLDREPVLILDTAFADFTAKLWVKDIRTFGNSPIDFSSSSELELDPDEMRIRDIHLAKKLGRNAVEVLCSTIKNIGLERGKIGVDYDGMDVESQKFLKKAFPDASIKNCSELLRLIRMVKSDEEIKRLSKAAEVNEKASKESICHVKPGAAAGEVAQIYAENVVREGASPVAFLYSKKGFSITTGPNYRFKDGDIMYTDFTCTYQMYYGDTGYTVMIGKPSYNSLKIYETLKDTMSKVLENVKPGVKSLTLAEIMRSSLVERGITGCYDAHGHGIGLEPKGYPAIGYASIGMSTGNTFSDGFVSMSKDILLEKGMVINLELPYFLFKVGSFQIEKTVLVTENGFSPLTSQNRDAPVII